MCSVAPYRLSATNTRQHSSTRFFLVLSITSALSIRSPEIYPQKKRSPEIFHVFNETKTITRRMLKLHGRRHREDVATWGNQPHVHEHSRTEHRNFNQRVRRTNNAPTMQFSFENKQNEEECNHRRQLHELRTPKSTSSNESKAALQQNQRSTRIGMQQQLDTAVMRLSCIRCSTKYKLQPTIKPCESPTST